MREKNLYEIKRGVNWKYKIPDKIKYVIALAVVLRDIPTMDLEDVLRILHRLALRTDPIKSMNKEQKDLLKHWIKTNNIDWILED